MQNRHLSGKTKLSLAGVVLILGTLGFCTSADSIPFSVQLIRDAELSTMMPFFKTIKIFSADRLIWEKTDLEAAVRFIEIEDAGGADIPLQGGEKESVHVQDINGDGHLELILETFSGGAHCCFEVSILTLGDKVTESFHVQGGNSSVRLDDLNGDSVYELHTFDDSFAYWHNSYADSPMAALVFEYDEGSYTLANSKYKSDQETRRKENERKLREMMAGTNEEETPALWDFKGNIPVLLLEVMLDRIYVGEWKDAVRIFSEYPMDSETRQSFRTEFLDALQKSRYWGMLLRMDSSLSNLPASLGEVTGR